ncbi:DUF3892 domain-containing protein [Paraburkholderia phymatum]|uniref:DUF3892 domain-containing protein n=2 Tax=Paraburkholderia phymatum TaxID=148447 RepID=UPI0026ABFF84|nr:DUF3892 domain-containing protein [Paraburkholderia phymatum]
MNTFRIFGGSRWLTERDTAKTGMSTRQQMVEFIEKNGTRSVYCPDRDPKKTSAWVEVHSNGRIRYVQTVADGRKTDNLLALPEK